MSRCKTPDALIGIGGGGSRVVYRFMSQKWLLDEVLKTEEYDVEEPDTLQGYTIDSATEDGFHNERSSTVETRVKNAVENSDYNYEDNYLTFDGPRLLPDRVPDAWLGDNLTDPNLIRQLCDDQNLNSWWMDEGREPLSTVNAKGFGGGVQRRRSVSKALYHISNHMGNGVAPYTSPNDEVAIVASLAGGTGSGMALDLARDIDCHRVHLYAILPHDAEMENEKTNAHAALSELEHAQLCNDNPFSTITLIPHIKSLEEDGAEFEMAVTRTIIAHQNGVRGGNLQNNIFPGSNNGPESYQPFTIAAPYTVKYDIERREEAEQEIETTLSAKRKELERERDLYEVVEQYLKQSFPKSAGAALDQNPDVTGNLETDEGREQALLLRQRIEDDIHETFLEQIAFDIAGLEQLVEEIRAEIDNLYETGAFALPEEDKGVLEEAREYIQTAPGLILDTLENNFDYPEVDGTRHDLLKVLKLEMENIERRRDLWLATSLITSDETEPSLDPTQARRIREGLRDGVLSDETEFLNKVLRNPRVEKQIESLEAERSNLEERKTAVESFHADVAETIVNDISDWRDRVWDDAAKLAAINEHEEAVSEAISDLEEILQEKAQNLATDITTPDGVDRSSLNLSRIGPLGEFEVAGLKPLDEKLEAMGVTEIDGEGIETGFQYLREARKANLEHDPARFIGGEVREEEFDEAVYNLSENGSFSVNPNKLDTTVEQDFKAEFSRDLRRESEIEEKKEELIASIVDGFKQELTSEEETLKTHSEDGLNLMVPSGLSVDTIAKSLEEELQRTGEESPEKLFKDVVSNDSIDSEVPISDIEDVDFSSSVSRKLVEGYLEPVGVEYEPVSGRLSVLVGEEDDNVGLLERVKKLQGLSSPSRANIELPQAHPYEQGGETYGQAFAQTFEGIYEIELEYEADIDTSHNPYLTRNETKPEDLVGAPDDISDTNILKQRRDDIVRKFKNSVRRMFEDDERVPLKTLEARGTGDRDQVSAAYQNLRFRPVYTSRGFDETDDPIDSKFEKVRSQVEEHRKDSLEKNSLYKAESYDSGGPDELTMVMFIGGVFLDNINLLTKLDGYKDEYRNQSAAYNFIGAHHTIGLGTRDEWPSIKAEIEADADERGIEGDVGGYVYRNKVRDVDDGEFIDELMLAEETDGEKPEEILLEMFECASYASTLDLRRGE